MKRFRAVAAATALCLTLTGCSSLSLTIPDVLAPPLAQGDQAQIQKLIEQNSGKDYQMIFPKGGENKSSVVFYDNNGADSEHEKALAFYSLDEDSTHVLYAEKDGSDYRLIGEGKLPSTTVNRVDFADMDGNGSADAVIGYTKPDAHYISLAVILTDQKAKQENLSLTCSAYLVGDFNSDSADDILTLSPATPESIALARLVVYGENGFYEHSSCEIDSYITEYGRLSYGKIAEDRCGAVIDCKISSAEYTTQLIYYDEDMETVFNPLYSYSGYQKTKRSCLIPSGDINRDDIIDIPLCSLMDYFYGEEQSNACEQINWCNYSIDDFSLNSIKTSILCDRMDFLFHLEDEAVGSVSARYTGENAVTFYRWEYPDDSSSKEELLTIKRYDKDRFDPSKIPEAVICETSSLVYTYISYSIAGYPGFSDDEVTDSFVLLDNNN